MTEPRFPVTLPVAPLVAIIARHVERHAPPIDGAKKDLRVTRCLADLGVHPRRYYEWESGRQVTVSIELADRVLVALGLDWLDVWGRDEYPDFAARLDAIDAADPWDIAMRRAA